MNVIGVQGFSFTGNKGKPVADLVKHFRALIAAGGTPHTTKQGVVVYNASGERVGSFPLSVLKQAASA